MTNLHHSFNDFAAGKPENQPATKKYPPPFSMRFTRSERARLDAERGRKPLSVYIRERLFGEDAVPRKRVGNSPVADSEALGRVLGALGQSRLSANLNQLAKAVNTGSLPATPETEEDLQKACREITSLRDELMRALGKTPESGP